MFLSVLFSFSYGVLGLVCLVFGVFDVFLRRWVFCLLVVHFPVSVFMLFIYFRFLSFFCIAGSMGVACAGGDMDPVVASPPLLFLLGFCVLFRICCVGCSFCCDFCSAALGLRFSFPWGFFR